MECRRINKYKKRHKSKIHFKIIIINKKCSYRTLKSHKNTRTGAGGGTRTHTPLKTTDFESAPSTNSSTPAYKSIYFDLLAVYFTLLVFATFQ